MTETTPVKYLKLPGSGMSRKGTWVAASRVRTRLWLGDDHLLQVESTGGYSETYKRFYFRDIQAFCLRRTKNWFATNVVLGFVTGIFLLWTLTVNVLPGVITLGIITAMFGLFVFLNLLRGPTCTCHLKTAVHYEELPSLRRLRNAEKVMARIRPLMESAQGTTAAETIVQQYSSALTSAQVVPATQGQATHLVDPTLEPYHSNAHRILFFLLLGLMVADALYIVLPSVVTVLLDMAVTAALTIYVLVALVKQNETDLKVAVRVVTWIACAFTAVSYIIGYVGRFSLAANGKLDSGEWGYIKALAAMRPLESSGRLATLLIGAAVAGILGVAGLLFLRQHWREKNRDS